MTVPDYVKWSIHSLRIDISFLRSYLSSGVRTRPRRYQMICVSWYVFLWGCTQEYTDTRQTGDYEAKGIIGSHATFSLSSKTKDLDEKFRQVLSSTDLDTAGGLVEILSRQGKLLSCFGQTADRFTRYQSICKLSSPRGRTLRRIG